MKVFNKKPKIELNKMKEENVWNYVDRTTNKEYEITFVEQDKMDNMKKIEIEPDVAKKAIVEYLENTLGRYIDGVFNSTSKKLDEKMKEFETNTNKYLADRLDVLSEKIVTELISAKFKDEVNKRVAEKMDYIINKIKE